MTRIEKKGNRKRTEEVQNYEWVGIDFYDPQNTNIKTQVERGLNAAACCRLYIESQGILSDWCSYPHFSDKETESKGVQCRK